MWSRLRASLQEFNVFVRACTRTYFVSMRDHMWSCWRVSLREFNVFAYINEHVFALVCDHAGVYI